MMTSNHAQEKQLFKKYIFFSVGQMFSILGSSVVNFATAWYYTIETHSASFLSLAFFLAFFPQIFTTLFAGVIIDRVNRKLLIFFADSFQAILTFILIVWFICGYPGVWGVVIVMIFRGMCQAFHQPAVGAIIPLMVPKKYLTRMNGFQFMTSSAINAIGPALAAILLVLWSFEQILWLDIFTFLIALIPLLFIQIPSQHIPKSENGIPIEEKQEKHERNSFMKEMKDGFKTIISIKGLIPLFATAMILNATLNPLWTLQTYFIVEYHGGTAVDLAWIMGGTNLAVFIGAIITIFKKKWTHRADWIMGCLWLVIIGYLIVVIAPIMQIPMMVIGAFLLGLGIPIINCLYLTIIQVTVPPEKLGRINSIDNALSMAIAPIMTISAGPIAEWIGIKSLFYWMIGISVVSTGLICFFTKFRTLNQYDEIANKKL